MYGEHLKTCIWINSLHMATSTTRVVLGNTFFSWQDWFQTSGQPNESRDQHLIEDGWLTTTNHHHDHAPNAVAKAPEIKQTKKQYVSLQLRCNSKIIQKQYSNMIQKIPDFIQHHSIRYVSEIPRIRDLTTPFAWHWAKSKRISRKPMYLPVF